MPSELKLLLDAKAKLGEGPSWDAANSRLYWVDIVAHQVHVYDAVTGTDRAIDVGEPVGAVVPRTSGGAVVVLRSGFYYLDAESGRLEPIADPEGDKPGNRFNDGKCDPAGRFWAGTMSMTDEPKRGALYCLDAAGNVTERVSGVTCSNGLGWSPDRKTMYYVDTPTMEVCAFDYDLATGAIANRRAVVRFPDGEGVPDGMCVDAEGNLWVAHWGGYQVSRWDPATGEKIGSIAVPVEKVTSCVFGGEQLNELYITTASVGADEAHLAAYPMTGGLFRVKLDVCGQPTDGYAG